ncbi:phospholipase A and acyltransferase 2-like [Ochotona curzoniae]|uniref:phospholipase A and acyltransferase 2-like n=1 Tax=Ochotona curzoniae TaxID=130825 RepID=UPI001B3486B0|nr:phospholipase A and acyltransferase 2-like [Ochotona curzoniae]
MGCCCPGCLLSPVPKPKEGDLIEIFIIGFQHWAVYVGCGYVVHMVPIGKVAGARISSVVSPLAERAIVKMELLSKVAGMYEYRVNNKHDDKYEPLPPNMIVQRAMEKVGKEVPYSLTQDNCEHFVNELRYGIPRSDQVQKAAQSMGISGVLVGFLFMVFAGTRSLSENH